jgi:aarF domain-containing kinase
MPGASISIMQIVAIKVLHPGVGERLHTDFAIMYWLASVASKLPVLRDMRFDECVQLFGVPLHQQLNLKLEAEHLDRFRYNFR